jgi:hypothetical protein
LALRGLAQKTGAHFFARREVVRGFAQKTGAHFFARRAGVLQLCEKNWFPLFCPPR